MDNNYGDRVSKIFQRINDIQVDVIFLNRASGFL